MNTSIIRKIIFKNEKRLNISLCIDQSQNLSKEDKYLLNLILEFSNLDNINLIQTSKYFNNIPTIQYKKVDNYINLNLKLNGSKEWHSQIINLSYIHDIAEIYNKDPKIKVSKSYILNLLYQIEAHSQLEFDLFITNSKTLLKIEQNSFLKNKNTFSFANGLSLIHLFLRNIDKKNFFIKIYNSKSTSEYSKSLFYWVVARNLLPSHWKIFSTCVASKIDELIYRGQSIINRLVSILTAYDIITYIFHSINYKERVDEMFYHFQYFIILLSGIFETVASFIYYFYPNLNLNLRKCSFRKKEFKNKITTLPLGKYLNQVNFYEFLELIWIPRNIIQHHYTLPSIEVSTIQNPNISYIIIDGNYAKKIILNNFKLKDYGILEKEKDKLYLEPFNYLKSILFELITYLDNILKLIDINQFIKMYKIKKSNLLTKPSTDSIWNFENRKRLHYLALGKKLKR